MATIQIYPSIHPSINECFITPFDASRPEPQGEGHHGHFGQWHTADETAQEEGMMMMMMIMMPTIEGL